MTSEMTSGVSFFCFSDFIVSFNLLICSLSPAHQDRVKNLIFLSHSGCIARQFKLCTHEVQGILKVGRNVLGTQVSVLARQHEGLITHDVQIDIIQSDRLDTD